MIVERIWTGNAYRNYNYLIACPESGEALAIDPLDHEKCLAAAKAKGWQITQILNTHEHHDHTGGNAAVVAATGAKVIAHHRAGSRIAGVDRGVKAGDVIKVGKTRRARMHGHARPHDVPHLPALAHRAAGAVLRRHAVQRRRRQLPQRRQPGRPVRDLRRAAREAARRHARLSRATTTSRTTCASRSRASPTTRPPRRCCPKWRARTRRPRASRRWREEKQINTFLRLTSPSVIAALREAFPDLPEKPDPKTVFVKLRELRNSW